MAVNNPPSIWSTFGKALLRNALQGASLASQQGGNLKDIGVTAGVVSLAGVIQLLLNHPATTSPVVLSSANLAGTPTPDPSVPSV